MSANYRAGVISGSDARLIFAFRQLIGQVLLETNFRPSSVRRR